VHVLSEHGKAESREARSLVRVLYARVRSISLPDDKREAPILPLNLLRYYIVFYRFYQYLGGTVMVSIYAS
jgi:hypothetical protein